MQHQIRGTVLPILDIQLAEGEKIFTETGGMAWKSPNVSMQTNTRGGVGKAIGRMFSGESFFFTTYTADSGTGLATFCTEMPGKILEFDITPEKYIICQRDAFMVGTDGIDVQSEFVKKLGAAIFGGEGFFLQKVAGQGKAFLEISGELTEYTLEDGQALDVDPGYLAAFEPSVSYDIRRVQGVTNMLFAGEGIFMAHLKGPGKVYLQSMPFANLARRIATYVPKSN